MINNIIGYIHLFLMILINIYGILFTNSNIIMDKIYIASFTIISLSWLLFHDECLISYIDKKIKNPRYILGSDPNNINDIVILFSSKKRYYEFYIINHILRLISIFLVHNKLCLQSWFWICFIIIPLFILYTFYIITLSINNYKLKNSCKIILECLLVVFCYKSIIN